MLISSVKPQPLEDMGGVTFTFRLEQGVADLELGFAGLPTTENGRLWVKLAIRTNEGALLSELPKWRKSPKFGVPVRALDLAETSENQLPRIALPSECDKTISINISGKRRYLATLIEAGTRMYVCAHDAHSGLRALSAGKFA